jgi:hypothetical protein
MDGVRLEIMPGLSRYFDAERPGRLILERKVDDGANVRDFLEEISSQSHGFKQMLFDARTGKLAVHISLILNGQFLELSGGLEAKLKPGDTLRLMLAFSGG